MVAERVLTDAEVNRAVLARQGLLERTGAPLPRVLERMGGLQAQYAPSMYVGLWSRVADLHRDTLTRALRRRTVVQGTLLRSTIHLVSAADYWPWALAVRSARRDWYARVARNGPGPAQLELAAETVRQALADGPMRVRDIDALIGREARDGLGLWLDLVRVPPSGTWERRRADLLDTAEHWLGPPPAQLDETAARRLLVRRYLRGFGPATALQVADWSGLPAAAVAAVLASLPLRRFRAVDGSPLVDLPRAPLPAGDTAAPVRFLPTWDALLLVHARRAGVLPEDLRPHVFSTRMPQSVGTVLVDGRVAATWRLGEGRVRVTELVPLARTQRREVEAEAARLERFCA